MKFQQKSVIQNPLKPVAFILDGPFVALELEA